MPQKLGRGTGRSAAADGAGMDSTLDRRSIGLVAVASRSMDLASTGRGCNFSAIGTIGSATGSSPTRTSTTGDLVANLFREQFPKSIESIYRVVS